MNRSAAIVVTLLSAASAAGAQPQLVSALPELCGLGGQQGRAPQQRSRFDLEVAQFYGRCAPSPRWLAVTVLENRGEGTVDRNYWVGETMIDRCDIVAIHPRGAATGSTIELAPTGGRPTSATATPSANCWRSTSATTERGAVAPIPTADAVAADLPRRRSACDNLHSHRSNSAHAKSWGSGPTCGERQAPQRAIQPEDRPPDDNQPSRDVGLNVVSKPST